jgi:hypothetical protein
MVNSHGERGDSALNTLVLAQLLPGLMAQKGGNGGPERRLQLPEPQPNGEEE